MSINLMKADKKTVRKYVRKRDAALNSCNDEMLKEVMREYECPMPETDFVFEIMKHKMRCNCRNVFPKLKKESRKWLEEHGLDWHIK